jgi:hypothetical protein
MRPYILYLFISDGRSNCAQLLVCTQLHTGFEAASDITPDNIGHDYSFMLSPHCSSLSIHLTKTYRDFLINLTDYLNITPHCERCSHNGGYL